MAAPSAATSSNAGPDREGRRASDRTSREQEELRTAGRRGISECDSEADMRTIAQGRSGINVPGWRCDYFRHRQCDRSRHRYSQLRTRRPRSAFRGRLPKAAVPTHRPIREIDVKKLILAAAVALFASNAAFAANAACEAQATEKKLAGAAKTYLAQAAPDAGRVGADRAGSQTSMLT